MDLEQKIGELCRRDEFTTGDLELFAEFRAALRCGEVRAAEKTDSGEWRANAWVKRGILAGFRMGEIARQSNDAETLLFFDKNTFPLRPVSAEDRIRIVPGGSSIRDGSYIGPGVVCMPPMYVNVGAYVGEGTMIDSHALVGSCAQIGESVHLSAAAQIGGVLEPVGAVPVVVEDEVLIGGNAGIYEGTIVRRRAVIASGVILTRSIPVFDLVNESVIKADGDGSLEIPENAVVVQGTRKIAGGFAEKNGLSIYAPLIVKYRDRRTEGSVSLEEYLR